MKSIIIRDIDDRILFKIDEKKPGVYDAKVAKDISPHCSIKVVGEDNSRTVLTQCKRRGK